jgi:phage terminase large subunit-like protein
MPLASSTSAVPDLETEQILAGLSEAEAEQLQYDWAFYARPNQLLPPGEWLTWLLLAGRGFGKTRAAAEAVRALVCGSTPLEGTEYGHIAIVAETAADARDVCVEGESGILSVHPKGFRPQYEPNILGVAVQTRIDPIPIALVSSSLSEILRNTKSK